MDRRPDRSLPHHDEPPDDRDGFADLGGDGLRDPVARLARAEMVVDERLSRRRVRRLGMIERGAHVGDPRHRPGDAGGDVAEDVAARFDPGDQVVRSGHDRVGEDRRVQAEMRIGGAQQPVEVDLADDAHRRRRVPTGPRETVEELAVRPLVTLARMLLDDDVDARQRPAEAGLEHVGQVRATDERHVHGRHDEQPVAVGDAELAADSRRSASRSGPEGAAAAQGVVGRPPGRRIEVEPRRPGDDHLARVIGEPLQDASLVVAEDERPGRQDQPRVASVGVAGVGRVQDPVLEREDRDARSRRGDQPGRAVTLLRHEHGRRVEVVDQALDAGELVHLGVDEASQQRPQLGGERRPDVQTVELERDGRHGGQRGEDGAGGRGGALVVLGAAPAGRQDSSPAAADRRPRPPPSRLRRFRLMPIPMTIGSNPASRSFGITEPRLGSRRSPFAPAPMRW